jgi:hypothetical protein
MRNMVLGLKPPYLDLLHPDWPLEGLSTREALRAVAPQRGYPRT